MSAVELPESVPAPGAPLLRTLVLCDLADSTALVERLGDQRAAALMRKHDRLARDLLLRHGGREIDKTDGFLVLFERPISGVAFALAYQRELQQLGKDEQLPLRARVGIHVGDVVVWENSPADVAHGAKPVELEGLVKPVAARLAGLALPGQILASGVAAGLSQRAHGELGDTQHSARWINHGRYRFKGVPEPLPVYEIGETGIAPLKAPPWSGKAHREVPWWRTPASVAIEAVLMIGLVGTVAWYLLRPPPAIAFAERDWVVVGDLRNLTGQALFDDSLQVAFRIGLEQSRFVNVVPDLQVRTALQHMQRDPAKTPIDRSVAAEVALREGAKAVILPTLAEVGGRVRISAEVIDPASQATVYSELVDGKGVDSVLPTTDTLLRQLRARLGESLASVNAAAAPLEKVTTANLDALKAYSLGVRALGDGKGADAISLFTRATELDGGFSQAYLGLANVHYSTGAKSKAAEFARKASATPERLSARERLNAEGYAALFANPAAMRERWSIFAKLYPDAMSGQNNLGLVAWWFDNDFTEAARQFSEVVASHHPRRTTSELFLADVLLAQGEIAQAEKHYKVARNGSTPQVYLDPVLLALAQGDDAATTRAIDAEPLHNFPFFESQAALRRAAQHAAHGRFAEAVRQAQAAATTAQKAGLDEAAQRARLAEVALLYASGSAQASEQLRALGSELVGHVEHSAGAWDQGPLVQLTQLSLIAARNGQRELAQQWLAILAPHVEHSGFHSLEQPFDVARCEAKSSGGSALLDCLQPLLGAHDFYQTRATALRAYVAAGKNDEARKAAQWLVDRPGVAVAEYLAEFSVQISNLIERDRARVALAENALAAGDAAAARAQLQALRAAWRDADADTPLIRHAMELETQLAKKD